MPAAAHLFLRQVLAKLPYRAHRVLTSNSLQCCNMRHQPGAFRHLFNRVCTECGIAHRFPKPAHSWANGPAERRNHTFRQATALRYRHQTKAELNEHLHTFLLACNHAKRLKTLRGSTAHEFFRAQ